MDEGGERAQFLFYIPKAPILVVGGLRDSFEFFDIQSQTERPDRHSIYFFY